MQNYPQGEVVVVVDCADLLRAAAFWSEALGYRMVGQPVDPYVSLVPVSGDGPELLLQRVPEPKGDKSRVHLDLRTRDLESEVARIVRAGAVRQTQEPILEGGWRWHILLDPDGNELCVLQPPTDHWTG